MRNLLVLLFFCNYTVYAQRIVPGSADNFLADTFAGYDSLGFAYFGYDNTFSKKKNTVSVEYKNVGLGKISRADILNPLKIVLLYENFNTVVMLDNQLNETQQIKFSEYQREPILVAATGNASRNRLWIFNDLTQQLALFDYLRNEYQILTQPLKGNIIHYETDFNKFKWVDENLDRYECDIFGKITFLGKVPAFDSIQFIDSDSVILRNGDDISIFKNSGEQIPLLKTDQKTFKSFHLNQQNLAIFTTSGITNFKLNLP